MGQHRYRQLLLFAAVLILPIVMIGFQGRRLAAQEQELRAARIEEIRKRTASEIGQEIVSRLERIKTQEMANLPVASAVVGAHRDPSVVAVGWIDGDQLLFPWDVASGVPESPEPAFSAALTAGKRLEFAEKNFDRASTFYRQAIEIARNDRQRASARLSLAGALLRGGDRRGAAATYSDLLKLPSSVLDENSLAYWSSAALPLLELGGHAAVLARVRQDVESKAPWTPQQLYRFKLILDALKQPSNAETREGADALMALLSPRLRDLEGTQKLQKDYPRLRLTPTHWFPYQGSEQWLIGRSPESSTGKPLVLAVRLDAVRESVEQARSSGPRFVIATAGPGDALSEYLPEMWITFPSGVVDIASGLTPQQSLWGLSFVLVGLLTFLGGYLLWRDLRREAHIAELRTQFVSSVSHELKTPLTSIRMFAELLSMRESNDPQQTRFLDTIVSESERLTRLLNNVLDFSRIERGQRTYRLHPTPLDEVIQAVVRTVQYPLTQQGFLLNLNVCEGIPPVAVDRDALQQAVLNLLTNAMKYSGENREIGLRLCSEKDAAVIEVSDKGIGIPDKEQSRIFQKFYRVQNPQNREISGTGLGLSLVAHIAEGHGGSVRVKSSPGEGSTFSICLPLESGSRA